MSSIKAPPPVRAAPRASHLRQVSNGSSDAAGITPTAQDGDDILPETSTDNLAGNTATGTKLVDRVCTLSVHDESFCRDDVLLNVVHFPPASIAVGDLAEIVAVAAGTAVRDFQNAPPSMSGRGNESVPPSRTETQETSLGRDRSSSNPLSLGEHKSQANGRAIDPQKRHVFVVKDMSSEQRAKQPGLQVSHR